MASWRTAKHAELIGTCSGAMLTFISVSMSAPLIPLAALELGASPSMMGFLMGVSNIGALLFAIPTGFIIRRAGTRLPIVLSGIAAAASCLFLYLFPTLPGLFIGLILFGIGRTVNAIGIQSHVGGLGRTGEAGANFAWYGIAIAVGQMIGPALAGVLISVRGLTELIIRISIGVGFGLAMPLSQATVFDGARPADRGLAMSLRMTGNRLASPASPLVFGPLVQYLSMTAAFGFGGLVLFAIAIPFFVLRRRRGDYLA